MAGRRARESPEWSELTLDSAARLTAEAALEALRSSREGLSEAEAEARLAAWGGNAVHGHRAEPLRILGRQLRNPLLVLLVAAATTSYFVGQHTDAVIILGIVGLSVGLGFFNEYRSERAVEELHSRMRHVAVVARAGRLVETDVTRLVPGDVVNLDVGDIVPADMRLLETRGVECDESVLTGESLPVPKSVDAVTGGSDEGLSSCVLMGTVVRAGRGVGVVVGTGTHTAFGRIAVSLGRASAETSFEAGLRGFSLLLVRVTAVLTVSIFGINFILGRPILEAALFSLAIAVGLTPQLLPAIVTVSLSMGARRLLARDVLVKRLVSIEDFGNVEVLFTDKTGTLTEGRLTYTEALSPRGGAGDPSLEDLGLLCNSAAVQDGEVVGGNPLDRALWEGVRNRQVAGTRLAELAFDYDRRMMSVLVDHDGEGRQVITKGAQEDVLAVCRDVPGEARGVLDKLFGEGRRVVAVATRDGRGMSSLSPADEQGLTLRGFLCFSDPPKEGVAGALRRLERLGVRLKVITGDNEKVARRLCADVGMTVTGVLTGAQLSAMSDAELAAALPATDLFARVDPEQKSRIIRAQRALGNDVGFLGDGVNDAVALHDADVGISVDTATDVARDAADIVLLRKDLDVLAGGVVEGRRIFANTVKYVLMGTSSNFGNMFSAAGASIFLPFLPMTPTQILLNNLLYDVSELTIPTDRVDEERLRRPAHWNVSFIQRFMIVFGPISSLFDFMTYGVMIFAFHAAAPLFQTGWFVESLATQTLVIFVIRTRRVPFFRSKPSTPLWVASISCVLVGALIPFSPLSALFGFRPLPLDFFLILLAMVATYLVLVESVKSRFFHQPPKARPLSLRPPAQAMRVRRLRPRWSSGQLGRAQVSARPRRRVAASPPAPRAAAR